MYKYRYGNGEWTSVNADRYEQDPSAPPPMVAVGATVYTEHDLWYHCGLHPTIRHLYDPDSIKVGESKGGRKTFTVNAYNIEDPLVIGTIQIHPTAKYGIIAYTESGALVQGTEYNSSEWASNIESPHPGCTTSPYTQKGGGEAVSTAKVAQVSPRYAPQYNESCRTVFYLEDEPVLTLESRHCPEVERDEECPEGTCKVDCDTHYCCYNSQGISTFSYSKS